MLVAGAFENVGATEIFIDFYILFVWLVGDYPPA